MKNGLSAAADFSMKAIALFRILVYGHLLARAVESAVFVVAVDTGNWGVGDHVIGEVPLAVVGGGVASFLQEPRQERRLGVEPVGHVALGVARHPGEVAVDIVARREVAGHDRGPAGRTHAAGNREAVEIRALFGKAVNIRRFDIRVPVATQVTPTPVVGKDEQDVGLIGGASQ